MQTLQALLAKKLSDGLARAGLPAAGELTQATDPRFGDYQTNAALVLGKQRGENPRALAQKIIQHLPGGDLYEPPTIAGAGFINFTLKPEAVAARTKALLQDDRLGVPCTAQPRRIVIDFGSPNVAKTMHVGHIRSTVLGDALARIATFVGHEVIRDNHIGDWGTQFGMVILGWKRELDRVALAADPLGEMERIYKLISARYKDDEATREQARAELLKLQGGDAENLGIWHEMIRLSQAQFDNVYQRLGVKFDVALGESFYNDRLGAIV